jgi:MFS family permease
MHAPLPSQETGKTARRFRLFPTSASPDARRLVVARGLRGFADGCVSVLLASYLETLGFSAWQTGTIVTGTLLGSAALTLASGLLGHRIDQRRLLLGMCGVMFATGIGFAGVTAFWPLLLIAVAGTLNPSSGDVTVFLPTEQALLSGAVAGRERTALFARYNLAGALAGALGALISGYPDSLAERTGWDLAAVQRSGFVLYALVAALIAWLYRALSRPAADGSARPAAPLRQSRGVVLRLAALFSLDSLAGGFVVQSMLVLWLFRRFDLSPETAGAIFFAVGVLQAFSQLASSWLAGRIGLIHTMVFTHLPSNVFLVLAALMPNVWLAMTFLLLRSALSQMDVPARQSYVMSVVPPEERAAAASVTNVPRSLAAASTPFLAGLMLDATTFGWPLILCGVLKSVYDLLLLAQFREQGIGNRD